MHCLCQQWDACRGLAFKNDYVPKEHSSRFGRPTTLPFEDAFLTVRYYLKRWHTNPLPCIASVKAVGSSFSENDRKLNSEKQSTCLSQPLPVLLSQAHSNLVQSSYTDKGFTIRKGATVLSKEIRPEFAEGKLLSEICTLGIGGPAKYFIEVYTEEEMVHVLMFCNQNQIRFFVVGKGSNCLFDDRGFNGCIIVNRIEFLINDVDGTFRVGSGFPFNQLGVLASRNKFSGLEFACGIPGTVGGAVFMNAGADQQETADFLQSVDMVSHEGERRTLSRAKGELTYGYRSSPFQTMARQAVITAATFKLKPCTEARQRQMMFMDRRRKSQPVRERSAGCIFRNPGNGSPSAGAVIDQLGLKGHSIGGASVSDVHANFLINKSGARCSDMLALIADIKLRASNERGIKLHEEVLYVPFQ